jgi:hypothetical protein
MFIRNPKMSPEGAPAGGGASAPPVPAAPAAAPTAPAAPAGAAAAPAAPAGPTPPVPPSSPASAASEAAKPTPEVKPPAAESKPEAAKAKEPDLATVLGELEATRKKTAELETALAKSNADARKVAFDAAFDRAGVMPDQLDDKGQPKGPRYRDYLKSQLGDIDPRTDQGKAAIDALVAQNPAMKVAHQSTEDPMSAFLKAKAAEAQKAGQPSMWGLIPPDMMRGYDIKGGE